MRAVIFVVCLGSHLASASLAEADTFQSVDTFGLDVATVWEPANGDAFGAGPLFRVESFTTKMPSWLGLVARWGMLIDSSDRVFSPIVVGAMVRPGLGGLYGTLEGGGTIAAVDTVDEMDERRVDWTASATLGYRLGGWDLHATALVGGLFERTTWMFSLGRDFVRLDATITRTMWP